MVWQLARLWNLLSNVALGRTSKWFFFSSVIWSYHDFCQDSLSLFFFSFLISSYRFRSWFYRVMHALGSTLWEHSCRTHFFHWLPSTINFFYSFNEKQDSWFRHVSLVPHSMNWVVTCTHRWHDPIIYYSGVFFLRKRAKVRGPMRTKLLPCNDLEKSGNV